MLNKKYFLISFFLLLPTNLQAQEGPTIPFHLQQSDRGPKLSNQQLSQKVEEVILQRTNQEREKKGRILLKEEDLLQKAAREHSQDMMKRNYLSHFSPEGKSVLDRVAKYQPDMRRSVGENLHTISSGQGLIDPAAIGDLMMNDWMHSSSHRKNILSKDFQYLGVGCSSDGERIFCTQVFGGPLKKSKR